MEQWRGPEQEAAEPNDAVASLRDWRRFLGRKSVSPDAAGLMDNIVELIVSENSPARLQELANAWKEDQEKGYALHSRKVPLSTRLEVSRQAPLRALIDHARHRGLITEEEGRLLDVEVGSKI